MADEVSKADIERIRAEADRSLSKHEIECERRYGEVNAELVSMRVVLQHNTRLLCALLAGMLAVAAKSFWPALFGG